MALKKVIADRGTVVVPTSPTQTQADIAALVGISERDPQHHTVVAAWNGHQFETVRCKVFRRDSFTNTSNVIAQYAQGERSPFEREMIVYYPIDPRINKKDIHGATEPKSNAAGDGWLFYHDDADHMRDREVELRAGLVAVLQPEIDNLFESVVTATDTKPSDWPLGIPWENRLTRRLKLNDILKFRTEATKCLLTEARKRHVGWYHQNPHKSHLHNLVHDCITTVLRVEGNPYSRVYAEIRNAAVSLAPHLYETRWEQEARLERERKAAADAAEAEAGE